MDFEWDPVKARANEEKHGVSFFEGCEVFDDELSSTVSDPDHSRDENRYLIFGMSNNRKYLVVSYTERTDTIRLISAREMTRQEQKAYEQ